MTGRPDPDDALSSAIKTNLPPRYHFYKNQTTITSDCPPVESMFSPGRKITRNHDLCSSFITELQKFHNFGNMLEKTGLRSCFAKNKN